jgi:exodeoxyribonuclease VII small subunit
VPTRRATAETPRRPASFFRRTIGGGFRLQADDRVALSLCGLCGEIVTGMDPTIKDFESAIAELETIVKTLEEGDLALEKSLALFERGVALSRFCHSKLEEAERRVEILNERGEIKAAPASLAGDPDDRGR